MYDYRSKKYIVFDIEANGFTPDKVHCICTKQVGVQGVSEYFDETLEDALDELRSADVIVGHNIIGFDLPVLKDLLGFNWKGEVVDTLVMSKVLNPDRMLPKNCPVSTKNPITGRLDRSTPHSLGTWGYRVGRGKIGYYDWETFDMDMLFRCSEDVEINDMVLLALIEEAGETDWTRSLELEYQVAQMIDRQERTGVPFDNSLAREHIEELNTILDKIDSDLRGYWIPEVEQGNELKSPTKKDGSYSVHCINWYGDDVHQVAGPFTRVTFSDISLTQRAKLTDQLLRLGWRPTIKTDSGNGWKITIKGKPVDSLNNMKLPVGRKLSLYFTYAHRRGQVQGWVDRLRDDGRLTAGADSAGTNTARMKHRTVVNCPKADKSVIFGKQMRQLFIPARGHKMVGWDASGLEARVMAHYTQPIDGGAFGDLILHGDIHTHNAHIFFPEETKGMVKADKEFTPYRNLSKNGFYALVYGSQIPTLAATLKISRKAASDRFDGFWEGNRTLGILRDKIIRMSDEYGYVPGIDGRKIITRSSHSALNALFQSAGSIIMKKSATMFWESASAEQEVFEFLLNMHDEVQVGVPARNILSFTGTEAACLARPYGNQEWTYPEEQPDGGYVTMYSRVGELGSQSVRDAGEFYKTRIKMDAEYKVGDSWAETH